MKKTYLFVLILILRLTGFNAQTFQVDTLQYHGDITKYINIVILGDGYTSSQQSSFITDAKTLSAYVLQQNPWVNYTTYINVFAIWVISVQSGATHPNTASDCNTASPLVPVSSENTYLGCSFDTYGIHRLIAPQNTANVVNVLATNFPKYDQVYIISNNPYYGGSGGTYATTTIDASSNEIIAHEVGHSFAYLADEYYAGDMYAIEKPNMTQQTSTTLVKWKNWLGYNGTSIYQHCCGGNSALWYKPQNNACKMQTLGLPYCCVCAQAIIETIHSLVNPIVSYTPTTLTITPSTQFVNFKLTEVMKPVPNTLHINWQLDAAVVSKNVDSLQIDQSKLTAGTHTVSANLTDTTILLRVDNHATIHFSLVTWIINKTTTGIELSSSKNKVSCSLYPNPSSKAVNISIDMEERGYVSIELMSPEGQVVRSVTNRMLEKGMNLNTMDIENLTSGVYVVVFNLGGVIHSEKLIKE